jgi:hypothetical protein
MMGIATAVLVYAIYDKELPDTATIHATDPGDVNVDMARKKATLTSAGLVSGIALVTKDVNIFVLGSVVLFALDMHTRHANATNPQTGSLVSQGNGYAPGLRAVS